MIKKEISIDYHSLQLRLDACRAIYEADKRDVSAKMLEDLAREILNDD